MFLVNKKLRNIFPNNLQMSRLEQLYFFSQWTREKMKIRLEKPALNISKLTGGKNEKARQGLYVKNFG